MNKRKCTTCYKDKETNEFYTQNKVNAKGESYQYTLPSCKECTTERANKYAMENKERRNQKNKTIHKKVRKKHRKNQYEKNKDKEKEYLQKWQKDNKNKLSSYVKRKHEISEDEWLDCLDYFSHCCAYCGLSEEEHLKTIKTYLHMEHVVHNGSNYIDNCVPSCKKCNSSKHDFGFIEWYNSENSSFDKERLNKIIHWITVASYTDNEAI